MAYREVFSGYLALLLFHFPWYHRLYYILSYSRGNIFLVTHIRKVDLEMNNTDLGKFFEFWIEISACSQLAFY